MLQPPINEAKYELGCSSRSKEVPLALALYVLVVEALGYLLHHESTH